MSTPPGSSCCSPAASRSTSPASTSCSSGAASGCASRSTWPRRSTAPSSSTSPSARRRPTPATQTSLPSGRSVDELPVVEQRLVLVMKSTVPVGTGRTVRHRLDARGLDRVGYASNPEFTAEGTAVRDFLEPDRSWSAPSTSPTATRCSAARGASTVPFVRCDVALAEMIKLAADAALMTRISFINEIANVCEATGADVVRVAEGIGLDRRIGPSFLRPDRLRRLVLPEGLAGAEAAGRELGLPLPAPERRDRGQRAAEAPGDRQAHAAARLAPHKKVALLGLAFKPNTDDMREAPSSCSPAA